VYQAVAEKFPVTLDENAQALGLIEQWIAEAPTNPDQVKKAEEDLCAFQCSLNQTRQKAEARLVCLGAE